MLKEAIINNNKKKIEKNIRIYFKIKITEQSKSWFIFLFLSTNKKFNNTFSIAYFSS